MSEEPAIAVFKAFIPPIKSGILISGDGTGGSIKLEIPQTEKDIFHLLMDMTQQELIVTIARAVQPEFKEIQSDDRESAGAEANTRTKGSAPTLARSRVQRPTDT